MMGANWRRLAPSNTASTVFIVDQSLWHTTHGIKPPKVSTANCWFLQYSNKHRFHVDTMYKRITSRHQIGIYIECSECDFFWGQPWKTNQPHRHEASRAIQCLWIWTDSSCPRNKSPDQSTPCSSGLMKRFLIKSLHDFQICSEHLGIWKHVQTVKQVYNYTHSLNFRIQMYSHNGGAGDERAATLKPDFTAHSNSIFSRLTKGPRADEHSPGWDVQRPPIDLLYGCF